MSYYTLTADTEAERAAEWAYRTAIDPILTATRSRVLIVALYQHAKSHGYVDTFRREYLARREEHMRDMIRLQRHWQAATRNPNKARHHDSIEIRERYVRGC